MSGPDRDLTPIVQAAAEAVITSQAGDSGITFDDLSPMQQHQVREQVLPIVVAVVEVMEPRISLADAWSEGWSAGLLQEQPHNPYRGGAV